MSDKSFNEEAFERNLHRHDEVVEAEFDAAVTIQIGMTHKEASALLPQVVTPSGTIKKYPSYTRDRSEKGTINIARMAVRAMDAFSEGDTPTITLFMPAGIIDLNPELAFYFEANEMWSDLAAKGWRFEVGK